MKEIVKGIVISVLALIGIANMMGFLHGLSGPGEETCHPKINAHYWIPGYWFGCYLREPVDE